MQAWGGGGGGKAEAAEAEEEEEEANPEAEAALGAYWGRQRWRRPRLHILRPASAA